MPDFSRPRNIERLMIVLGMDQTEFAREVDASPSAVSRWLFGAKPPGKRTVRLLRCMWECCRLRAKLERLRSQRTGRA